FAYLHAAAALHSVLHDALPISVVPEVSVGATADLAAVVAAAGELGLSLLLENHRLLSHSWFLLPLTVGGEGSAQESQQLLGLLRSEERTSDIQSRFELVCRLLP